MRADHLAAQFRGIAPLFAALAPYPTVAVTRRGPHRQEPYASVAGHPELPRIHALYRDTLTRALEARGITYVAQPAETVAGPFLTKTRLRDGRDGFPHRGQGAGRPPPHERGVWRFAFPRLCASPLARPLPGQTRQHEIKE